VAAWVASRFGVLAASGSINTAATAAAGMKGGELGRAMAMAASRKAPAGVVEARGGWAALLSAMAFISSAAVEGVVRSARAVTMAMRARAE
jgi:hypothetical protein